MAKSLRTASYEAIEKDHEFPSERSPVKNAQKGAEVLTLADDTLDAHLLCFAAEEARKENTVVDMQEFRAQAQKNTDEL